MNGISHRQLLRAGLLALFAALTACGGGGGGGGGGGDNPPDPTPDVSPDTFSFSPQQVDDAVAGGTYIATATVTGFDGELSARVTGKEGNASHLLMISETEAVEETTISAGDTLTLRIILGGQNSPGSTASATVTVGEGGDAKSATFTLTVVDKQNPQVSIHFPTARSVVQDETLTITGGWSDDNAVERITSLGDSAEAILLPDNRWQMTVALQPGRNEFALEAHDASGNRSDTVNVEIFRQAPFFDAPRGIVVIDGKLMVLSTGVGEQSIRRIDPETLENSIISSASVGDGPMWASTLGPLAVNADNTTLYLVDRGDPDNNKVLSIDVATGNRTVLAEELTDVRGITAGLNGNLLLVGKSDGFNQMAVIAIDETGNRQVISRPGAASPIGGGDSWAQPVDLAFDANRNDLYVLVRDTFSEGIYSVDIGDDEEDFPGPGDRAKFSVSSDGNGPAFDVPTAIDVDVVNGDLYVVDFRGKGTEADKRPIFRVPTSGANARTRSVISNNDDLGPELLRPSDVLTLREDDGLHLLVADGDQDDGIIKIQATDGAKTKVPGEVAAGEGEPIDNADALAVDLKNNRLLLSDTVNSDIRGIDLATGNRSASLFTLPDGVLINEIALDDDTAWIVTGGETQGLGSLALADINPSNAGVLSMLENTEGLQSITSLLLEPSHAFVDARGVGGFRHVVDIELESGNFTEVWNNNDGVIPGFNAGVAELIRVDETHLLTSTVEGLILADTSAPENRRRFIENIASASALAHDPANKRVVVFDSINDNLAVIDVNNLDEPVVALLFGEGTAHETSAGYGISLANLIQEMRYDTVNQRLYLLSEGGDELTVVNMSEIRFDADEDGDIDENDVIDGVPATRISGEAVLLSRGGSEATPE